MQVGQHNDHKAQAQPQDLLAELEHKIQLHCPLCRHPFDSQLRQPKMVCRKEHTFCSSCLQEIRKERPMRCPDCKFKIFEESIFVNRTVLAVAEYFPNLRTQLDLSQTHNQHLRLENQQLARQLARLQVQLARQNGHLERNSTEGKDRVKALPSAFKTRDQVQDPEKTPQRNKQTKTNKQTHFALSGFPRSQPKQQLLEIGPQVGIRGYQPGPGYFGRQ